MKKFFKKIDYKHYILLSFVLISLVLSIFIFTSNITRVYESLIDIKNSFLYYLDEIFDFGFGVQPTVNDYSKVSVKMPFNLPDNWEDFKVLWHNYWEVWASWDNFKLYIAKLGDLLFYFSRILLFIMPIFSTLFIIKMFSGDKQNNDFNKDSKALKRFKKFEYKICSPVRTWIKNFLEFARQNSFWYKILLFIWAYNFNFVAIFFELFAYYFYFVASISLSSCYIQIIKLLKDLCSMIVFIPTVGWVAILLFIIDKIRRKIGYSRLNHKEMCNRGFINERPIVLMVCGTMGKKKTTMITDIALSEEIMLRDKAFEKILECDLKFPYFPWINLENDIKKAINNHNVYNLSTCKRFIDNKKKKFLRNPTIRNIFCYNINKYRSNYDNSLYIEDLWKVLKDYSQLYFIYIMQSSLLISNYSIRVDNIIESIGNFPLWNSDFFKKDSRLSESFSRHSHILDFDSLRLGRKLLEDSKLKDSFEFGVINITEIGKERGNNLELQELKKKTDETNQKNDLFNSWLKLVRHSATVDNFPFVKVITDEQRPESWGADARDLCEIVYIEKTSELCLAMPLFNLGSLFFEWWQKKFIDKYIQYRFNRGDNTLPMYLYHGISSLFFRYYSKICNVFGYYNLDCLVESGRQDSEPKQYVYYLMTKKIYSKRFSTDCFSDYFYEKTIKSEYGLNDILEYKTEKATFEELMQENSYFFNDLIKLRNKEKDNQSLPRT